ncbi:MULTISPECIES: hypothetical protein [unclassified Flavobacterium]|uniref:hypothetical protein n=1 Tax=unclassified Flavobacterium TaxID=196869 RepID=UPI001F134132|nr:MULTISPECIES: hypothetical protein [unclassified Flavobacterium]UMY64683.1 hypothetical protein MKO97_09175 [Flavobacterium sp. HJ-32-4]
MSKKIENQEVFKTLIESYRNRSSQLKKSARLKFNLVVMALFMAILIFIFAGFLTAQISKNRNAEYEAMEASIDKLLVKHKTRLDSLNNASKSIYKLRYTTNDSKSDEVRYAVEDAASDYFKKYGGGHIELLQQAISQLEKLETKKEKDQKNDNYFDFFTTLSTRIGAILILIFLVQLLIRIYRYDIRIANYYDARADALEIHSRDSNLTFDKIISMVSPDIYDIGTSKSPSQSIISLLQTLEKFR